MAKTKKQIQYNVGIDNIAYLIVNHPEALKKLLSNYDVHFKEAPNGKTLTDVVLLQFKKGGLKFQSDLEALIQKLSNAKEDQFLAGLIKGAVGIVGGIISKSSQKKQQRKASRSEKNYARAQEAQTRRDLEIRRQQMEEERRQRAVAAKEKKEERLRREAAQAKKEAASKKKTNIIIAAGLGVVVLGVGAMVFMNKRGTPMGYANMPPPNMPGI